MSQTRFQWWRTIDTMTRAGVQFAEGLCAGELSAVESYLGTRLPPDHRALLREALPVGPGFPNWRELGSEALATQVSWPFDSLADALAYARLRMQPPEVLWSEFRRRDKKWMPEEELTAAAV